MTGRTELLRRDSRDLRATARRRVALAKRGADRWDDCLQRAFIPTKDDAPAGCRVAHGRLVGRAQHTVTRDQRLLRRRSRLGTDSDMAASPLRLPTRQPAP